MSEKDTVLGYSFVLTPPPSLIANNSPKQSKLFPPILSIIAILLVLFFISRLLHLLAKFLAQNPANGTPEASRTSDALQELFHSQGTGLDQAFIDALPSFGYNEVVGTKIPFDCAVCLSEFTDSDRLRLLPTCGHAFHFHCIDTWLLSNSTCPLCRGAVLNPGLSKTPVFNYKENEISIARKRLQIDEVARTKRVFPVRLGKFRKLDSPAEEIGESSGSIVGSRRCYSMGSYEYIIGEGANNLRIALGQDDRVGECCNGSGDGSKIGIDSHSVSKIWLWSKKGKFDKSSEGRSKNVCCENLDLPPWMDRTQGI